MTAEVGETTRRVARNAVISGAGEVVGKVATFAVIAFAARELAVADFGAFSFAFALCLLIATLPGWGLAVVLMHEGAAQPEKMQRFLAQVITVRMVAGIPITAAVWLFASRHDPASDRSVMLISLLLAVVVLGELQQTARSAATGRQRLGGVTLALIADRVVTAGIGIVALRAGAGVVGLGIAFTAGALVSCAGSFYVLARIGVTPDFSGMNARDLVRLIRRTTFAGLDEMIAMALFRLDAVLLGWMDGDAAVATYAAGYRLLETVLFISWAISRAVSPAMSANAEPWRVRRGVEQGSALAAFCYLPFIAVVLIEAPKVIRLLFGSTYEIASTPAARLLAVTPMAFALGYLMSAALNSRRRYRLSFTASAIAVLVNVVANLILIPLYSERGAAAATSGAYALEAIVLFFMLAREAERPHLLGPALPAIVATIPLAVLLIALDLPIVRELALGGAVYLSVWFLLARRFAREQVDVLLSLVGR